MRIIFFTKVVKKKDVTVNNHESSALWVLGLATSWMLSDFK